VYTQTAFAANLFAGQVAVVTGGGSGIGFATAQLLHALGAQVALLGRRPEVLAQAAEKIEASARGGGRPAVQEGIQRSGGPPRVMVATCDIREPPQVQQAVAAVLALWGRIDVLVNNAGGQFASPALAMGPRGFAAVVNNNLNGTYHMLREVAEAAFFPRSRGVVVNVIMPLAQGTPLMAHSGAARAGVENLTRTLAIEWAAQHVRLNCLAPGVIQTDALVKSYPGPWVEAAREATLVKRLGTAREVACGIVYLASPLAAFINGTTLVMDGGAQLDSSLYHLAGA
jgi:citronellol/citronellal dehydrogenase